MIYWPAKTPGEVEDFAFDFTGLLATGESIASHTVTATGVTVDSESESGGIVTPVISGGTLGTPGVVTCEITTDGNPARTYSETAILPIGTEPVSLVEAKTQVRMTNDDSEDLFIASLIMPARAYVERLTRFFWVAVAREETFGAWGEFLEIYRRPITSVDEIAYVDADGANATYEGFIAPVGKFPLRISPGIDNSFPALGTGGAITVSYTSGALDAWSEEYLIGKRAMLLLIGDWFENRENFVLGTISQGVQFALDRLIDALRPVSAY